MFGLLDIAASVVVVALGLWLPGLLAVKGAAYLRLRRQRRSRSRRDPGASP